LICSPILVLCTDADSADMLRVTVADDLLQVELEAKQQLSTSLPADTVEYESTQPLARPAAAAAGAVEEDVNALITSVRSMGRMVANGAGMSLVA